MRALLALLLVLSAFAGCVGSLPEVDLHQQAAAQAAIYDSIEHAIGEPLVEDHDHADGALHNGAYNLRLIALEQGNNGAAKQPTESYLETAVKDGYAYVCRTGPNEGLVIFDVHDIEHPVQVGYIKLDAGFEADIEVSDDGKWAFWETQRAGISPSLPDPTDPLAKAPRGIHIIDISDKANPTWVGFTPVLPDGPHSITYANISGEHYVFASIYSWQYVGTSGLAPAKLAPPMTQRETIYKLDTSLPVVQLMEVATYIDENATEPNPAMPIGGRMPHDVTISKHPFTNRTYAYIAYWDLGVVILDVTDPANPVKVGQALDFGVAPTNEVHMARQAPEVIDGKVIVVVEPEIDSQETTGYMSMIDVSDPAHPAFISNWKIPGNTSSLGGGFGPHYFDILEGRVALASYHAGFWVFDIHDKTNLYHPRTVAFAEVGSTGAPLPGPLPSLGGGSSAFDAWWVDSTHILGGDINGGMAIYRYEGPTPAVDHPVV